MFVKLPIFFSYSHEDDAYRHDLEKHLKILERHNLIEGWSDRKIAPGSNWQEDINFYLTKAKVILLLISADFLESDYCYETETIFALEQHEKGLATVIPILIRPCYWEIAHFKDLQILPSDGRAVSEWENKDAAWLNVVKGLNQVIEKINKEENDKRNAIESALEHLNVEISKLTFSKHERESEFNRNRAQLEKLAFKAKDKIQMLADSEIKLNAQYRKMLAEQRQVKDEFEKLSNKLEVERNSIWGWLFGWEEVAEEYERVRAKKLKVEDQVEKMREDIKRLEHEKDSLRSEHKGIQIGYERLEDEKIDMLKALEGTVMMIEKEKQKILSSDLNNNASVYDLQNERDLIVKFNAYSNGVDAAELEINTLLFNFLKEFHTWYFTSLRILGFGSLQTGFEQLRKYSPQNIENALRDMANAGLLRAIKSNKGNNMYRIA